MTTLNLEALQNNSISFADNVIIRRTVRTRYSNDQEPLEGYSPEEIATIRKERPKDIKKVKGEELVYVYPQIAQEVDFLLKGVILNADVLKMKLCTEFAVNIQDLSFRNDNIIDQETLDRKKVSGASDVISWMQENPTIKVDVSKLLSWKRTAVPKESAEETTARILQKVQELAIAGKKDEFERYLKAEVKPEHHQLYQLTYKALSTK